MGSLSKSVLGMKKRLSSAPQCPDDLERQIYPVKLMQHQEETVDALAQKINQIIAKSSAPFLVLQEIAHLLGVAFQVDCCCMVTVTGETSRIAAPRRNVLNGRVADEPASGTVRC
jgi:phosphoserine phosphatase